MNEEDINEAIDKLASWWRQETETTIMKIAKDMEYAICGKKLKAWLDKYQEEVTPLISWFLHENFDLEETVFNDDFLIAAKNKMRSSFQDGHYGTIFTDLSKYGAFTLPKHETKITTVGAVETPISEYKPETYKGVITSE